MNLHRLRRYLLLAPDAGASGSAAPADPNPADPKDPAAPAESGSPAAAPADGDDTGPEGESEPKATATKKNVFARAGNYLAARGELLKKISAHEAEISRLTAELGTATSTISTQAAELKELRAGKAALEKAVATLEADKKSVSEQAADLVAGQGVPHGKLPPVSDDSQDIAASDADHLSKYASLKGSEKTAYYRAHKEAITRAAKASRKK